MKKIKDSKEYVLNHQYGYGQEEEKEKLNKLTLRNIEDLLVYVNDCVIHTFNATFENSIIIFNTDNSKYRLIIEDI